MTRVTPMENLDVLGPLNKMPQEIVGTFIESSQQNKLYVKRPNFDSAGDGIELFMVQNDRALKDMLSAQWEMRENAQRQHVVNVGRIEEITKMQKELRKRFITANNFLKECDDKRRGANEVVKLEKQLHEKLKEEIKMGKINIEVLNGFRSDLRETVAQMEPYERVINEVVASSDVWNTVKDCTDSCDALMLTQVEVVETKRQKIIEIEDLRLCLIRLTTDAAATLLGLNNELTELERAYAVACNDCLHWEKIFAGVKDAICSNNLYIARMQDEIVLMYRLVCNRRGMEKKLSRLETEKMLDLVRDEIRILNEVLEQCTKAARKSKKSLT